MRKVVITIFLALCSCQVPSKIAMNGSGGRNAYNTAIQMTNSQQMLLNLVRLRYIDAPLFLEVSGVTTQMTYRSRVSPTISIPGFDSDNPFILGGELSWQDQPTISYAPLDGKAFTSRLLRPIHLSTLQQLIYSGWEIDRIFLIMLQNFDDLYNAPEVSGPLPEKIPRLKNFSEVIDILHYFQYRGELQVGISVKKNGSDEEGQNGEQTLQLLVPDRGKKSKRLFELLPNAKRQGGQILLSLELGFNERGRLGIMPRNILSCMYYLSQGVNVPDSHYECGLVQAHSCACDEEKSNNEEMFSLLDKLFSVEWSYSPPNDAYVAVKYRNYWYYIRDCDLSSKKTFVLLMQLYNLHAEEAKSVGPILTLPLR